MSLPSDTALDARIDALEPLDDEAPRSGGSIIGLLALIGVFVLLGVKGGAAALLVVGLIIFSVVIHEFGHFLTAKRSGMKVTEFFLGFGPRIFSFRVGETEYGVKPLWAGAYVKIIGMSNLEEVDPAEEERTYRHQPFWQRFMTVLGGPLANIAFGFLLFAGVFATAGQTDTSDWLVDRVVSGTAAAEAGVQPGDRIVRIGTHEVREWSDLGAAVFDFPGDEVEVVVERNGERLVLDAVIGEQVTREAANAFDGSEGLESRDRLVALDGEPLDGYADLRERVAVGDEVTLTVDRHAEEGGDRTIELSTTVTGQLPADGVTGFFGIGPSAFGTDHLSVPESIGLASSNTVGMVGGATKGIITIFSPSGITGFFDQVRNANAPEAAVDPDAATAARNEASTDDERVVSVVGVVQLGTSATEEFGIEAAIMLVASLNIFLAVLNLIPLLPFDGGHASIALYEGIRTAITGRQHRADVAKLLPVAYTVVAFMVSLGLAAIYLDAVKPVAG
jgi:membrane-associated protease RseP (regulator of RpoE activity)